MPRILSTDRKRRNLEGVFGEKDEHSTAEAVLIYVGNRNHPAIRKMLTKHESIWLGKLGAINVIAQPIYLILER